MDREHRWRLVEDVRQLCGTHVAIPTHLLILDALIGTEVAFSYAWGDIRVIPRRILPPKALVVALSPLVDERAGRALLELRARGFDVVVLEISPGPFLDEPEAESERLARRIWELKRQAVITSGL